LIVSSPPPKASPLLIFLNSFSPFSLLVNKFSLLGKKKKSVITTSYNAPSSSVEVACEPLATLPSTPTTPTSRPTPAPIPKSSSLDPEDLGAPDFAASSLLAFPRPGTKISVAARKLAVLAIVVFNAVVWLERRYFFEALATPLPLPASINRLANSTALELFRLLPRRKSRSGGGGLGKAGSRSEAQKVASREYGQKLLASFAPGALVAYTDGSANPNPGPAGAGAYVGVHGGGGWNAEACASLGLGSNNLGELWAIGMALDIIDHHITHNHNITHAYICTDSQFSLGALTKGWKIKKHTNIIINIKQRIDLIRHKIHLELHWVPAHVGIQGNEHADFLADRGAHNSKIGNINIYNAKEEWIDSFIPPSQSIAPFNIP